MEALKILTQFLATITIGHAFLIRDSDNLNCTSSRVQCLSSNTYTTCFNIGELTILLNRIFDCPEGFICSDDKRAPCILDISTTSVTDIPSTTTLTTTTKEVVSRPTGKPDCKSTGFWPAQSCKQYYECVKDQFLWIVKYKVELRTCLDGYYFDSGLLECILAEESDCIE